MAINVDGFSQEIEAANILASAQASDVPAVVALEDRLREGQIYLSIGEVFSTDLVNNAFVSTDGVDLRGPLVLENLKTAVNLCNWLDTDTILRTCWSLEPKLADQLDGVAEFPGKDRAWVKSVFARLTRENPPVASEAEALARYDAAKSPARMLSTLPANQWLAPASQLALRLWFITRIARDHTALKLQLDETWYKLANERDGVSREDFQRIFQVDLGGVGRAERGWMGIGGNFFTDLGKSISKLFRNPLDWFRSAVGELGKALAFAAEPFAPILDWFGKTIGMPALFKHPVRLLFKQIGNMMQEYNVTAFKEQELASDLGNHLNEAGTILSYVAGALVAIGSVFPPAAAIGAILGAIAAIAIAAGQGILAIYRVLREQRLADLLKNSLPTPKTPAALANAANNADANAAARKGSGGSSGGGGLLVLLAMAMGAR